MIPDYFQMRIELARGRKSEVEFAICAVFRDEGPYIAEWVTFHRLMGVERFYLYDNNSDDDWREQIAPEIETGVVEAIDWPKKQAKAQQTACIDCLKRHRSDARWIALLDLDEFLFSPSGDPLPVAMRRFSDWPGVLAGWRTYGTNGFVTKPAGLVTESYLRRAPDDFPQGPSTKAIVDPLMTVKRIVTTHVAQHYTRRGPFRYADTVCEDGSPLPERSGAVIPVQWLRINHYRSKSEEEAATKKRRGRPLPGVALFEGGLDPEYNAIQDDTLLRYIPQLQKALNERSKR